MFPALVHSCHLIEMMFVLTLLALVMLTHAHYCKSELSIEIAYERKDGLFSAEPAPSAVHLYPVLVCPPLSPTHLSQTRL